VLLIEDSAAPPDRGDSFGFHPLHDQEVKKSFVAAVLLSAVTLRVAAAPAHDVAAPKVNLAATSECLAGPDMRCDRPHRGSPQDGSVRRLAPNGDTEFEKWAVLLLEVCAAGWVLVRSGREAKARRSARPRSTSPRSEVDETASTFRAF